MDRTDRQGGHRRRRQRWIGIRDRGAAAHGGRAGDDLCAARRESSGRCGATGCDVRQGADLGGGRRYCAEAADIDRVTASTVARFGPAVHALITNDGGPPIRRISELSDEVWMQALSRHFFYVVRSVRATLPYMTAEGGSIGRVVSGVVQRPAVGMAASVAVWSAVIGYAKTLALEVGQHGITVNTLMSGLFDTALLGKTLARQPESSKEGLESGLPMGGIGQPHEFARVAALLVSPEMVSVTGVVAPVDGGSGDWDGNEVRDAAGGEVSMRSRLTDPKRAAARASLDCGADARAT